MLYLSSILDLYNGEVVAYSIADKQDTSLVLDMLDQLPERTNMLLHIDQGACMNHRSQVYQTVIKGKGITMSACPVKARPLIMPPLSCFILH
ncbi:DDE-type integrase/transposase/recombinase [Paenibacillus sp. LS1]|uniref:DDE-type integrase/transposase/recombinase n=1 Tax=Paenibacillus sp. LS1 TaxID=2992120 RepID=UPI0039B6F088